MKPLLRSCSAQTEIVDGDAPALAKQVRTLRRKLNRSEADRAQLELTREKSEALLRQTISHLADSRTAIEAKGQELERTLAELEATRDEMICSAKMAALGELVAGVAHEVNTPIGTSVTAASHLNDAITELETHVSKGDLTKNSLDQFMQEGREANGIILRNLSRAAELIESFKHVAVDRSFSGKRRFFVGRYIDEVMATLHSRLRKTHVTVTIKGDQGLEMDCDPGLFSQVLTNLVMNSLMHGFDDGDEGQITILYSLEHGHVHLTYQDSGKGIDVEHIDKVFDPFFTTRRGSGGSGLGLSIIYNIVTSQLGGTIRCESSPGQGVSFFLQLPGALDSQATQLEGAV